MSDLVKRLREAEEDPDVIHRDRDCFHVCREAADSIEQLERELEIARNAATMHHEMWAAEKALADWLYRGGVMVGDGDVTTPHEAYRKARGL